MECVVCGKELVGRQRKFCSTKCKSIVHSNYQIKKLRPGYKNKMLISNKVFRDNRRKKVDKLIGNKCFICGRKNLKLICHKKDGLSHDYNADTMTYALKHSEEMVRLCYACHRGVHWSMKHLNISWNDIIERLRSLKEKRFVNIEIFPVQVGAEAH